MKVENKCRYYEWNSKKCTMNNGVKRCFLEGEANRCEYIKKLHQNRSNGQKQALQEDIPTHKAVRRSKEKWNNTKKR